MRNLFPALLLVSRLIPDTSSRSFFDHSRHLVFDVGVRCKQANHANCFFLAVQTTSYPVYYTHLTLPTSDLV